MNQILNPSNFFKVFNFYLIVVLTFKSSFSKISSAFSPLSLQIDSKLMIIIGKIYSKKKKKKKKEKILSKEENNRLKINLFN